MNELNTELNTPQSDGRTFLIYLIQMLILLFALMMCSFWRFAYVSRGTRPATSGMLRAEEFCIHRAQK